MEQIISEGRSFWQKLMPITLWFPAYRRAWLKGDIVAGLTLASYALPGSMAYAGLAGLPPQVGIYCYIAGGLIFSLFTTSKHLAIGPISSISLLVGTTLAVLSGGDPMKWLLMASLTALGVGLISFAAYIIRLSSLVNFISETVLLGFKAGAALAIASTVLPDMLGIKGGGNNFFQRIYLIGLNITDTNVAVLTFGMILFGILIAGDKYLPGKPVPLLVVIVSIVLMFVTSIGDYGIQTVGHIPSGLPTLSFPLLGAGEMATVIDLAFACFVLAYIETISAARSLAMEHKYEIDPRQELLSLGAANVAASISGAYPVSGGLSQSAVNEKAGGKTPLSLIICSIVLSILLMFFTGPLSNLPKVLLAAIVFNAVLGLFKYKELKKLYHLNKQEFIIAMFALSGVLLFGILKGVMIAALLSLGMVIQKASKPHLAKLGRIGKTHRFSDIERHPENTLIPGVLIIRIEASLLYFNAQFVRDEIIKLLNEEDPPAKLIIIDLSASPWVDVSGSKMLLELSKTLKAKNIALHIVESLATARDMLRKLGLEKQIGHISRKVTVNDVVDEFLADNHLEKP
jgi:sulfate permease, SulP family